MTRCCGDVLSRIGWYMFITFLVRLADACTEQECDRLDASLETSEQITTHSVRYPADRHSILVVKLDVSPMRAEQCVDWASAMEVSEQCWLELLLEFPYLADRMAEPRLSWWPIIDLDIRSTGDFGDFEICPGTGRFMVGWDGAIVGQERPGVSDQWCEIAVKAQAQWTATTNAIKESKTALRVSRQLESSSDRAPMDHLLTARYDLVEALVELDARAGLFYEFEHRFVREIHFHWRMVDQIVLAERCLESVSSLITISQQQALLASQRAQERSARSTTFWLFLVTMASGVSVLLVAVDFVSSSRSPTVGNALRLAILAACAIVTGAVSWRQRRPN